MHLHTTLAVTSVAAALTFNFWHFSGDTDRPIMIDEMQPVVADVDDDLTLMLRHEARTAVLELQQKQAQF